MWIGGVDWGLDVRYHEKTFRGKVRIHVEDAERSLVLDSVHLTIDGASIDGQSASYRENPSKGTLEFAGFPPGAHVLDIAYHGAPDPESHVGLYVAPSGAGYVLTTMMFPSGSGRLLPTFEHPGVKTVYRLTLTVDLGAKAIFNTAPREERSVDGRREIVFEPTPPMSAYLLYLGVGPFDTLSLPGAQWSVTVDASPGHAEAGRYSAERATELLAAYEEYYGIPYPLSKLDLVAVEKFAFNAMENWGAIACREEILLVDSTTSVGLRRVILEILAHEIAHQWFGNLVTPAWWNDLWLNESFATFVGCRIISRRYPLEDIWTGFLTDTVAWALEMDSFTATHPVEVPVASAQAAGENADPVTYGKGAAVLWMIESYLGEDTFRRGVSRYLSKHRFANARTEDLWTALGEVSERPVGRIMSEWITRPGHPVVHASWADGRLTLRQERFRADGASSPESWPLPLRIRSSEGETVHLFEGSELSIALASPEGLRINSGRTAFARTHYDPPLFDRMVTEFPSMAPVDQWGLVVDAHAFVYANLVSLERFLGVVRAGAHLENDLPVHAIRAALADLYETLYDVPAFEETMRGFLRAQLDTIGLEGRREESEGKSVLRELLVADLAKVDPDFARALAPRFAEFDRVPAALRLGVATAYARSGDSADFDSLVARLRAATLDAERMQLLRALAELGNPALIRRGLDLIPSPGVNPRGALELLRAISKNPKGRGALFDWYRDHAQALTDMWAGTPMHGRLLHFGLRGMGADREAEVIQYFADHPLPEVRQAVQLGLESLHLSTRLRQSVRGNRAS
jgi:tricorn protease interacting factor F2/3